MGLKKLPANELQAGMLIAEEVTDKRGRTIIKTGTKLTPMFIKRITKMGIEEVSVEVELETPAEAESSVQPQDLLTSSSEEDMAVMRQIAMSVQKRFSNLESNTQNETLKRLIIKHLVVAGPGVIPIVK